MRVWAGPCEYTRCNFPIWEKPTLPGSKARPTLILASFETDLGLFHLAIAQTTHPTKEKEVSQFFINVMGCTQGLRPSERGQPPCLDLRKFMVLDANDRAFFPDGGKRIGRLMPMKFREVVTAITAQNLRPRMRAVMEKAPLGLREICTEHVSRGATFLQRIVVHDAHALH